MFFQSWSFGKKKKKQKRVILVYTKNNYLFMVNTSVCWIKNFFIFFSQKTQSEKKICQGVIYSRKVKKHSERKIFFILFFKDRVFIFKEYCVTMFFISADVYYFLSFFNTSIGTSHIPNSDTVFAFWQTLHILCPSTSEENCISFWCDIYICVFIIYLSIFFLSRVFFRKKVILDLCFFFWCGS